MSEDKNRQEAEWMDNHMKNWRSWGSWFSWGSPVGLSIFLLSIAVAIWILANL